MSKYKILIEPDPILRQKCEPIDIVDDELRKLMRGMLETMYKAPGIGLAAIQLGILKESWLSIYLKIVKKSSFFSKSRNNF